jgi:hypothetical protein
MTDHLRFYELNCIRGTGATPYLFRCWALGVIEAFEIAKASGYWPLNIASLSFTRDFCHMGEE